MKNRYLLTAIVSLAISGLLVESGQAFRMDDADKLEGQYVVKAGDMTKLNCPPRGKYDCMTWPRNLYRISVDTCFEVTGYGYIGYGTYGLLTVDDNGFASLFTLGSGISGRVERHSIGLYECPAMF